MSKHEYDAYTEVYGLKNKQINIRISKIELEFIKSALLHAFAPDNQNMSAFFIQAAMTSARQYLDGPSYQERNVMTGHAIRAAQQGYMDMMEFERKKKLKFSSDDMPTITYHQAREAGRLGPDNELLPPRIEIQSEHALKLVADIKGAAEHLKQQRESAPRAAPALIVPPPAPTLLIPPAPPAMRLELPKAPQPLLFAAPALKQPKSLPEAPGPELNLFGDPLHIAEVKLPEGAAAFFLEAFSRPEAALVQQQHDEQVAEAAKQLEEERKRVKEWQREHRD